MKTNMITRIFMVALFAAIISAGTAYAASPAAIAAKNIRETLYQAVQAPEQDMNIPTSGDVEVLFSVNDQGKIDVKKLDASTDEASKYVKEKIAKVEVKDFVLPFTQYYKVKFSFREP
jgi:ribonuclease PH